MSHISFSKSRAKLEDESWLSLEFSSTLVDYHQAWAKRKKTVNDTQEKFEQVQIRWERMRVDESWGRTRVSGQTRVHESLNSQQPSSSFGPGLKCVSTTFVADCSLNDSKKKKYLLAVYYYLWLFIQLSQGRIQEFLIEGSQGFPENVK